MDGYRFSLLCVLFLFTHAADACLRAADIISIDPANADKYGFTIQVDNGSRAMIGCDDGNCTYIKVSVPESYKEGQLFRTFFETYMGDELISRTIQRTKTMPISGYSYLVNRADKYRYKMVYEFNSGTTDCTYYKFTYSHQ